MQKITNDEFPSPNRYIYNRTAESKTQGTLWKRSIMAVLNIKFTQLELSEEGASPD